MYSSNPNIHQVPAEIKINLTHNRFGSSIEKVKKGWLPLAESTLFYVPFARIK
tara:strand:+ start:1233 stop:1391 length:159 start_codon:yes stop_codon:yes gene_type:complete